MSDSLQPDEAAILDRMTDAFFALNTNRRFTYLNERGREIVCDAIGGDLTIEELRGRHIWEEISDAVDTPFYEQYERALETQESVTFEAYYEPLETWFEVRAYPSESGLSVYFQDIRDRKRDERRLRRQAQQFEGFGEILSHDLKNPLTVAKGWIEMARVTGELTHIDDVENALRRMETLIDDMATVMQEGTLVGDVSTVDLESVARSVWETTETETASLVDDDTVSIQADENALTRLLENLLRNAVEHGGSDVTVTVGTLPNGFYVADDGPGVSEDAGEDVFEPTFTTGDDDTGFGLVSVQQIALAHGWNVTVTESETDGARFEFTDVDTN